MSRTLEPAIRVGVDPTNPGQFFACCGLLELADRLWGGAEGWFEGDRFNIHAGEGCCLSELLRRFKSSPLAEETDGVITKDDEEDDDRPNEDSKARPLELALPSAAHPLRLDWWTDKSLKPWAGSMNVRVIYHAMTHAIDASCVDPLNDGRVVFDPASGARGDKAEIRKGKKREPFYFDARRGASARSLDIGFAPDAFKMTTIAFPAVESLCLVGLQRFRPMPTATPRVFDYYTWTTPLEARVASCAVCGLIARVGMRGFRFENAFRTDQKKHKAFSPATPLEGV